MKLKYLHIIFICYFFARVSTSAEPFEVTANMAPIVYAAMLPQTPPIESVMEEYNPNYVTLKGQDEFAAHDLLLKNEPIIQEAIQRAKNANEFSYETYVKLGEYDFDRGGFPISMAKESWAPNQSGICEDFNNNYHIHASSDGPLEVNFLPVPLKYAESLEGKLRQSRQCVVHVTGTIYHVELERWIYFCPKSITVSLFDGTLICHKPDLPAGVYNASVPRSSYSENFLKAAAFYTGGLYAKVYGYTTNNLGERVLNPSDYLGKVHIIVGTSKVSFIVTDQEKEIRPGDFAEEFIDARNLGRVETSLSANYLGGISYLQLPEKGQGATAETEQSQENNEQQSEGTNATQTDSTGPVIARGKGFEIRQGVLDDVMTDVKAAATKRNQTIPPEQLKAIKTEMLNRLIQVQLLLQKATDADRVEGKKKADSQMNTLLERAGSQEALDRQFKALGISMSQLRGRIEREGTAQAALIRELKITVTDAEARSYYDSHPSEFLDKTSGAKMDYSTIYDKLKAALEQQKSAKLAPPYLDKLKKTEGVEILDPSLK